MTSSLKPWLILAVIFIAGGFTGAALTMVLSGPFMHPPGMMPPPPDMQQRWLQHLSRQLNLTADQQAKIGPILQDTAAKMQKIHDEEFDKIRPILKASDDQIAAILTPGQQAALKQMIADREKAFEHRGRPWGGPHDGPGGMHFHDGEPGGGPYPGGPMDQPPGNPPPPPTNAPPH
jgi:Spy/CpxP family protein refolding chaperone